MGMDTVELVMKIEDCFNISIPNKEAETMITVNDFYLVVARHLALIEETSEYAEMKRAVNEIIAEHAGYEVTEVLPHLSITNDLGLD